MSIAVRFSPKSMDVAKYNECIRRLEQAGAGTPPGRLYHVCYGSADQLGVVDVWESQATFDEFGKTLMPILQELGIDPGEPEISEVHSIITA